MYSQLEIENLLKEIKKLIQCKNIGFQLEKTVKRMRNSYLNLI